MIVPDIVEEKPKPPFPPLDDEALIPFPTAPPHRLPE
jgi:hypothetical protein